MDYLPISCQSNEFGCCQICLHQLHRRGGAVMLATLFDNVTFNIKSFKLYEPIKATLFKKTECILPWMKCITLWATT